LKANHRSPISAGGEKGRNLSRSVVIRQLVKGLQICDDVRCHRVFHWAICGVSSVLLCACRCSGGRGYCRGLQGASKLPMQVMENGRALKSEIGQRLARRYVVKFDCSFGFSLPDGTCCFCSCRRKSQHQGGHVLSAGYVIEPRDLYAGKPHWTLRGS
jgi:hypothetical protein